MIKLKDILKETASKEAMGIAGFTGTRAIAVQKFIDDFNLNAKKLFNFIAKGKLKDRMDFSTAISGKPGNKYQGNFVGMFGESVVSEVTLQKGKTYGGTKCEGGCFMGKEGLKKIIKISKDSPKDVFMFRDDNYSGLQPHFVKDGVIAKATVLNPAYDLEKHKVRSLNIGKDVILSVRLFVSTNESVNEGLYHIGYNKGRGQGTGVFKDSYSSYKDAKKAVEKLEKERGGSYNTIAYYVADKDGKFVKESVTEAKSDYEVYHKSYTSAIQAAREYAEKKGYEINNDDAFTKIGMGPRKPSEGKTNKFSIELSKDGKVQRKKLQIQVYGMRNSYELNAYIQ
jgi:hypothetical protein